MLSFRSAAPALLVFTSLLLAGCTSDPEPVSDDAIIEDELTTDDVNGTADQNVTQENLLPEISLQPSVLEGDVPLNITVDINATDEDGDALTWSLYLVPSEAAGNSTGNSTDNGTGDENATAENDAEADNSVPEGDPIATGDTVPTNATVLIEEAGTWELVLAVDDGTDVVTTDVTVTAAIGDPNLGLPEPVVIEGSGVAPTVIGLALQCIQNGVDGGIHDIAPAEPGWDYVTEPGDQVLVYWWSGGSYQETGDDAGVVPAGADQAEICLDPEAAAVNVSYTMTLTHPDYVTE